MEAIAKTETRPARDNRLTLELTTPSGRTYSFEIGADPYYRALKDILLAEKAQAVVIEPISHPSDFEPTANPS